MMKIIIIMLLIFSFITTPVAFSEVSHNNGTRSDLSTAIVLNSFSVTTKNGTHQHSKTQDCHGISCQFYILISDLPHFSIRDIDVPFLISAHQWAETDLGSLYRPPRSIL